MLLYLHMGFISQVGNEELGQPAQGHTAATPQVSTCLPFSSGTTRENVAQTPAFSKGTDGQTAKREVGMRSYPINSEAAIKKLILCTNVQFHVKY